MKDIYNELLKVIDKENLFLNEPMSKHTTFKIGGPADIFIKVNKIEELIKTINMCKSEDVPITVIGNGSNILVKDRRNKGRNYKALL